MSEHRYTQRDLADFRLDRGQQLKPCLRLVILNTFRSLPDAESRADAFYNLLDWQKAMQSTHKARRQARTVKRPRITLAASNPEVVRTATAMPRAAFRVLTGQPLCVAVAVEQTSDSPEPEAA
jgi:hypothetical protein